MAELDSLRVELALARAAAAAKDERLHLVAEAAGICTWEHDLRTGQIAVNEGGLALYGLPPDTSLGLPEWLALVHPEDRARVEAETQAAFDSGRPFAFDYRILRADDGTLRWLHTRGRRVDGPEGEPRAFVGFDMDISDCRQAEAALVASERRYRALVEAGAVAVWRAGPDGEVLEIEGWEGRTGQPARAQAGFGWLQVVHPEDRPSVEAAWATARAEGRSGAVEYRVRSAGGGGGAWHWVRARAEPIREDGRVAEWIGVIEDIHERRQAEAKLAASESRFLRAISAADMGTWELDLATGALHLSPGHEALYRRPEGSLASLAAYVEAVHAEDRAMVSTALARVVEGATDVEHELEFRILWPDGTVRWLRVRGRAERGAVGRPLRLAGVTQDVTERRQAEAQIAFLARHDALTGLPNRTLFRERLDEALAGTRRGTSCAVLCIDLDRFKLVNDTLGHPVGDGLLREVTARLRACLRETDTIARLGGDEFAVVQVAADQPRGATVLAERIVQEVARPFEIDGHQLLIGASVGIAVAPGDGAEPALLLKNADLALYRAKQDGRGRCRFFEPGMDARLQARRRMELDLRQALAGERFQLHYQPLVDLRTGQVEGFEALLRWPHPERGFVPPAEFIPLAEEVGLIAPIGEWVLAQACAEAAGWPAHVRLAVNISAAQFSGGTLVRTVAAALEASGLPPSRLELEVTETVMLRDTEENLAILQALRALGVGISMDDFGTGYSSLSYLSRFPFDKVKIDRSFTRQLEDGGSGAAIIRAILSLCGSLGMRTVVEGVESLAQLEGLSALGCTEMQGHLFSPARPASEVRRLLATPLLPEQGEAAA